MELLTPRSHESGDFYLKPCVSLPGFVWTGLKAMPIIISVARFPIAPTTYKNKLTPFALKIEVSTVLHLTR